MSSLAHSVAAIADEAGEFDDWLELHNAGSQIKKTTELVRVIGARKWRSSAGPASQVCTWNHGDADMQFPGNHWLQDLLDRIVFSGAPLPDRPAVR